MEQTIAFVALRTSTLTRATECQLYDWRLAKVLTDTVQSVLTEFVFESRVL